jgi:hypothetical protein
MTLFVPIVGIAANGSEGLGVGAMSLLGLTKTG